MEELSSLRIGNAAGFIKGPGPEFDDILRSPATDITIGSITTEPRAGNPGNTYVLLEDGTSVNALGLPNPGIEAALRYAPELHERAREAGKRLRWSVAGFSPQEYGPLTAQLQEFGKIELNLGCPNVWSGGVQKPIASFDLDLLEAILVRVSAVTDDGFDVKLSPYSDPGMIPRVVEVLDRHSINNVVTCNTFPNGKPLREDGRPELDPGYGGIGGTALRNIALGQVAQFAPLLSGIGIECIGVGGVASGGHAVAILRAGAHAVQVGTAFGERRGRVFSDIIMGLP